MKNIQKAICEIQLSDCQKEETSSSMKAYQTIKCKSNIFFTSISHENKNEIELMSKSIFICRYDCFETKTEADPGEQIALPLTFNIFEAVEKKNGQA